MSGASERFRCGDGRVTMTVDGAGWLAKSDEGFVATQVCIASLSRRRFGGQWPGGVKNRRKRYIHVEEAQ